MLHHYTVWAPEAERVDLVLGAGGERTEPMQAAGEGWWAADAEPGDGRYSFALDDGDPWPDPRGRRQPDGVHAPSALVDMSTFTWTDHDWAGKPLQARIDRLHALIAGDAPNVPAALPAVATLAVFRTVLELRRTLGEHAFGPYIISMSRSAASACCLTTPLPARSSTSMRRCAWRAIAPKLVSGRSSGSLSAIRRV